MNVRAKIFLIPFLLLFYQSIYSQSVSESKLIDSFQYANSEVSSLRIDGFWNELKQFPNQTGFIIIYGGKVGKKGEIEAHIRGIKQAFRLKGINEKLFQIKVGGFRELLTIEFWRIPQGAELPKLSPTVDAKKVIIKGISRRIIPYECCY